MSSRYYDERSRKGSSHSHRHRDRSRSRSRSSSSERESSYSKSKSNHSKSSSRSSEYRLNRHSEHASRSSGSTNGSGDTRRPYHKSDDSSGDDVNLPPPPPPMISKVSLSFGKPAAVAKPVQLKLSTAKPPETTKKISVASAFSNNDSDDEVEEMPAECRMRMRNIGRDTPTSSGPNSYGKTKQGFCDAKKIFEKQIRDFSHE